MLPALIPTRLLGTLHRCPQASLVGVFACAHLLILYSATLPATETASNEPVLTLTQAAQLALAGNLGLRVEAYNPLIEEAAITIAEAQFDTNLRAETRLGVTEQAATADLTEAASSDLRVYSASASKLLPTGATATLSTSLVRSDSDAGSRFDTAPDYQSDIGITVRQPLLRGAGLEYNRLNRLRAEGNAELSRLRLREEILDVLADTERAYWQLAHARAELALRASSVEAAQRLVAESEERARLGLATRIDVLQSRASLASRREAVIVAEQGVDDAADALATVLGNLRESPFVSAPPVAPLTLEAPNPPPFEELWPRALAADLDGAQQEEVIRIRELDLREAKQDRLPQLDVTLGTGLLGRDDEGLGEATGSALERDGHYWNAALVVTVPWGRRESRAEFLQANRRLEQERSRLVEVKQVLLQSVRQAWRDLATSRERLAAAALGVELQEESFAQEQARYANGIASLRDVLEAQRDRDEAVRLQLDAALTARRAEITLTRLDGTLPQRLGVTSPTLEALLPELTSAPPAFQNTYEFERNDAPQHADDLQEHPAIKPKTGEGPTGEPEHPEPPREER